MQQWKVFTAKHSTLITLLLLASLLVSGQQSAAAPLPVSTTAFTSISAIPNNITLHGSLVSMTRVAHKRGALLNRILTLNIVLKFRSGTDPEAYVQSLYDPSSPDYHQFLTPSKFADMFGASAQDYQTLINWLNSEGLKVTKTYADRMVIDLTGKARTVEKAFGVTFSVFQFQNLTFYSNIAEAQIPSSPGVLIKSIMGLNNLT